jgi:hypothetical protein
VDEGAYKVRSQGSGLQLCSFGEHGASLRDSLRAELQMKSSEVSSRSGAGCRSEITLTQSVR